MKRMSLGILAHVDAGKTTLSEGLLYQAGNLRKLGRVDHRNAFLDYDQQERSRGITIFSKQAILHWNDVEITLIDTPGHVDFSTEMERTLQVLDAAVMIISGIDGVQSHSETIWRLLQYYHIPTYIFVNKMDISYRAKEDLLAELKQNFSSSILDFQQLDEEELAMCDEELLESYLSTMNISKEQITGLIQQRKCFPCYFGSALKQQGVKELIEGLACYYPQKTYPSEFGAKIFKITHDENHQRLTHLKITGGQLKAKQKLADDEKVDQIRRYNGSKYAMENVAEAGMIVAVKGFSSLMAGEGLGFEQSEYQPQLTSFMNYRLVYPATCDRFTMLKMMQEVALEDPQLAVSYDEQHQEIRVQLMGEVQQEVLAKLIEERYQVAVSFDQGKINYKETILDKVEGVGHYEPLRHYAEVHLILEPLPMGEGLQFASVVSEDELSRNWQRLILSHLQQKQHKGVLTGSPITDMKITLCSGKSHLKHTEGGDFRQATYRAVRQGLKKAKSIVLEPYVNFRLEVDNEVLARAIHDIERMNGTFEIGGNDKLAMISGSVALAKIQHYQNEVAAYTKGKGKLTCIFKGYEPCQDQEGVIESFAYDSESDIADPTGSVFCSHGSGFNVAWNEVEQYMHLPYSLKAEQPKLLQIKEKALKTYGDEDLADIFLKTYGEGKRYKQSTRKDASIQKQQLVEIKRKPLCILVDGYNMIFSWPQLKEIARENMDAARSLLMQMMGDYQGYRECLLILVFDAYQVSEHVETLYKDQSIYVVYTKQAQTADMYIEKTTHELSNRYHVIVATSDGLEQLIVISQGAHRMSARELLKEVEATKKIRMKEFNENQRRFRHLPMEGMWDQLEEKEKNEDE